jgi:hypothetical protein
VRQSSVERPSPHDTQSGERLAHRHYCDFAAQIGSGPKTSSQSTERTKRKILMQIGKPLRTIFVEPLESPVPSTAPDAEPEAPEPVAPAHKSAPEPEHDPATP